MKPLILLFLVSCASAEIRYDYIVRTLQGTFLCKELVQSPYGSAAKNCQHTSAGYFVKTIPNPYDLTLVKE